MNKKIVLLCINACTLFAALTGSAAVFAQDSPYLGEVRWFAGNFAPRGWAFCDGQLLQISQYSALFSILGTTYGGDGRTNFALPEMRGRDMVHEGTGPGLTNRRLGEKGGAETATLTVNELPSHTHPLNAASAGGNSVLPHDRALSRVGRLRVYDAAANANEAMGASSIAHTGASQGHTNMQPSIALNCIIALQGIFPSRN